MPFHENIIAAVGRTPLVKLNKVVGPNDATVLVKCEYLNPTGSIKDRMAVYILDEAEKRGEIKPGGTIVENTSGNTGQGVAMWACVHGYRCVFTMPDKMSIEKVNMLKAFGAEVVITPTDVPGDSPEHYVETAKRIARETPNSFYVNQYHNQDNIKAHELSTGPEIWEDTGGKFDVFVSGAGTGGTLSGVGRFLKKKAPQIRVVGVDPIGSVHYHYYYTKTMPTPHVYKVEGIGEDILCDAMDYSVVDEFHQTNDKEAFTMARRLIREEGFFCGGSSGCSRCSWSRIRRRMEQRACRPRATTNLLGFSARTALQTRLRRQRSVTLRDIFVARVNSSVARRCGCSGAERRRGA